MAFCESANARLTAASATSRLASAAAISLASAAVRASNCLILPAVKFATSCTSPSYARCVASSFALRADRSICSVSSRSCRLSRRERSARTLTMRRRGSFAESTASPVSAAPVGCTSPSIGARTVTTRELTIASTLVASSSVRSGTSPNTAATASASAVLIMRAGTLEGRLASSAFCWLSPDPSSGSTSPGWGSGSVRRRSSRSSWSWRTPCRISLLVNSGPLGRCRDAPPADGCRSGAMGSFALGSKSFS